jgi:hypothetical protein
MLGLVEKRGADAKYRSAPQWDRQPYLTVSGVVDGFSAADKYGYANASILKAHDVITKNFFINGYNGATCPSHCRLPHCVTRLRRGLSF